MADARKINIAFSGGPCTGKSTLAAAVFARLKAMGYDYDLVSEECRKLKREFGQFRSPFERFYMWRQQEREELRSTAADGFVTDYPLFHYYVQARQYAQDARDKLAVRELFRMCTEIEDRYPLIVMAKDPCEIAYKTDQSRHSTEAEARRRHALIQSFVEHFWPERLYWVKGSLEERVRQVEKKVGELRPVEAP